MRRVPLNRRRLMNSVTVRMVVMNCTVLGMIVVVLGGCLGLIVAVITLMLFMMICRRRLFGLVVLAATQLRLLGHTLGHLRLTMTLDLSCGRLLRIGAILPQE